MFETKVSKILDLSIVNTRVADNNQEIDVLTVCSAYVFTFSVLFNKYSPFFSSVSPIVVLVLLATLYFTLTLFGSPFF